ncbi:MAG: FkbM family methyltransferase [Holophaga sp.]|nr:FkbM family methyltransferase [Holophaga sp.]
MPDWLEQQTRIVIYAAGGHTRDLLQHPGFRRLAILGIVDRDPGVCGKAIDGIRVHSVDHLPELAPDLVIVSSPRAHERIVLDLAPSLKEWGMPFLDLYAGVKPYRLVQQRAKAQGMVLEEQASGTLRLTSPGSPNRVFIVKEEQWIYTQDLLSEFDYYFNSVFPDQETPLESIIDISKPGFHKLRGDGIQMWFPSLPEPEVTTVAYLDFAQIHPGDHVVDLGAYAGGSSYTFAQAVGTRGKVLAVEPDPLNYDALVRNVSHHGLSQVIPVRAAVWESNGESLFQAEGSMGSSLSATLNRDYNLVSVPTLTLESLLDEHGFKELQFLKMDIEGAELKVIAQAMPLLCRLRPRIVIEPHFLDGVLVTAQVREVLEGGGYHTTLLDQGTEGYPLVGAWMD